MKILIIKTSSLGDIIQAFPVVTYLKTAYPHAQIDWIVEDAFASLVRAHPLIDTTLVINTRKWKWALLSKCVWKEFGCAWHMLRLIRYDYTIDLQGNVKSALLNLSSRAKKRGGMGFRCAPEWPSALFISKRCRVDLSTPITSQYLFLAKQIFNIQTNYPSALLDLRLSSKEQKRLEQLNLLQDKPCLMICFGSKWEAKKLPIRTWKRLLSSLLSRTDFFFFFVWQNNQEKDDAIWLQQAFPQNSQVLPLLSLPLWQKVISQMDGVLSVDSAALHLCATTNTPSFSLFGPSNPSVYQPKGAMHSSFQGVCPYGQFFKKRCPYLRSCLSHACMTNYYIEDVVKKILIWWDQQVFLLKNKRDKKLD